jgi:hypothetical protein
MDHLLERVDALEQQLHTLQQQTHTANRRLRWWRGLACALVMLGLVGLPLYEVKTQAQAPEEVEAQEQEEVEAQALTLEQRVARLESKLRHVTRSGRNLFITGANLNIRNGLRSTDCGETEGEPIPDCPNGLGNLIVGYNEPRDPVAGETIRTGSHNVVVGQRHNFSCIGGLVIGHFNTIHGDFAAVSGGQYNTASGRSAVVSGGEGNTADGRVTSVSGGRENMASRFSVGASVSGGVANTASGDGTSVSGGDGNTASGFAAAVSGGQNRTAEGEFDWVAGSLLEDE